MGKRLLSLIAVATLVGVVGCSNPGATTSQPTSPSNEGTETTQPPPATAPTEETAAEPTAPAEAAPSAPATGTSDAARINNPETLVLLGVADPIDTLDPGYAYDSGSASIIFNIYETLIFYDGERADRFVPMLATQVPSAENGLVTDGGLTYTFPIRVGTAFHEGPVMGPDGAPIPGSGTLSAEDAAYSMQRMLLMDRSGGPSWMMLEPLLGVSSILEHGRNLAGLDAEAAPGLSDLPAATLAEICADVQDAVRVEGDNVVFTLKEPFSPFLQVIVGYWASVLDKEWVAAEIADADGNVVKQAGWDGRCDTWTQFYDPQLQDSAVYSHANGTGPYALERWRPGEEIYLVRNETYWRERPAHLKDVSYKFAAEMATRLLMLQQGDADIISVPISQQDQVEPLVAGGQVTKFENLPTSTLYFWQFNQKVNAVDNDYIGSGELDGAGVPPDFFTDPDVRKGFAYAMDWETYLEDVINGEGVRARGPIHSTVFGFNPDQSVYEMDLAKAEIHLRRAWGGRLWDAGFRLVVPYVAGGTAVKLTTEVLAQNLARINPKFQLVPQDFQNTKISQDGDQGKVPFDYNGWHQDYHDPHNWAFPILHSRGYYARNMGIAPELQRQLDSLINQARVEQDEARRAEIYHTLQRVVYDEALIITLEEWERRRYLRSWLKGYVHNTGYPSYYFWHFYKDA